MIFTWNEAETLMHVTSDVHSSLFVDCLIYILNVSLFYLAYCLGLYELQIGINKLCSYGSTVVVKFSAQFGIYEKGASLKLVITSKAMSFSADCTMK